MPRPVALRPFPNIGGVVQTHTLSATVWAQARREIPALGTTHADYFHGPVPVTRLLTAKEIREDYETNTGRVIVERFKSLDPAALPGVLVASHGPFAWGATPADAVHHAVALEYCTGLAAETARLNPRVKPLPAVLLAKHFLRKHGAQAYYGQKEN
jgi:L-ribulose-5-phosphate 4-epimerase